jgi:hypothetical protein
MRARSSQAIVIALVTLLSLTSWVSSGAIAATAAGSAASGESRDEPIELGETGEIGDYEVAVVDVTPDADDIVAAENQFNEEPAEGTQFYLVRVAVTYTGSETGNPGFDLNFQAVGAGNVGYTTFEDTCGVTPDDEYSAGELFPDGAAEYNVCWQIDSEDADSLQMYVEPLFSFGDDERVWFSLDDTTA